MNSLLDYWHFRAGGAGKLRNRTDNIRPNPLEADVGDALSLEKISKDSLRFGLIYVSAVGINLRYRVVR